MSTMSLIAESTMVRSIAAYVVAPMAVVAALIGIFRRQAAEAAAGLKQGLLTPAANGVKTAAQPVAKGWRVVTGRIGDWWRNLPATVKWSALGLFIVALYYLPIVKPWPLNTQADFASLLAGTVMPYIIVALGLNVVVGMAGLLDLGYVGFYAVGAYTLGILTSKHANWPWIIVVFVCIAVAMFSGVILGAPTLRLRGDYLAIVTLGFGEIIRLLAERFEWLGDTRGINNIGRPPTIGPIKFGVLDNNGLYWLGLTLAIIVYFFLKRIEQSRVGRAWTAVREDEDAAELMGVPTFQFKLWAFAIGAGVGGLAGMLYATKIGFINPDGFKINLSILFLAAVVLGGPGTCRAPCSAGSWSAGCPNGSAS